MKQKASVVLFLILEKMQPCQIQLMQSQNKKQNWIRLSPQLQNNVEDDQKSKYFQRIQAMYILVEIIKLKVKYILEIKIIFNYEIITFNIKIISMHSTKSLISKTSLLYSSKYYASKQLLFGTQARKKLLQGCKQLADAVQVTLGPGGRNVLIDQTYGSPKITKDGVTVAKAIQIPDKSVNIGASLVKSVANKTNDEAGDGTTTATILARAIFEQGFKKVESGLNPTHIKRGIDQAVQFITTELKATSTVVKGKEAISNVATISANGDRQIGNMLAQLYEKVGVHGTITIQEGKTLHHEIEYVDGLKFDRGYVSPYFVTDDKKQRVQFQNCYILSVEKKISNFQELLPYLEFAYKQQKPLLIIAEDVESEILANLIVNKLKGNLKVCVVKAPSFGDNRKATMQDIAVVTGGQYVAEQAGISLDKNGQTPESVQATLGLAKNVTITKDDTIILHGNGTKEQIQKRVQVIQGQISNTESNYDKEKLQQRLAKLRGGVGVIKVGGGSEVEVGQVKDRVTDALCATKAAISEGIVSGGGTALLYASKKLDDFVNTKQFSEGELAGIRIIQKAIRIPCMRIAENAGHQGGLIVSHLLEKNQPDQGFNAATGQYVNMKEKGIIDPTKVVRTALVDASSVASLMLTTECMIFDEPEKKKE